MKVAIIGSGYVGLVTGVGLSHRGHEICCYDVNPDRLQPLQNGKAPFFEPGLDDLLASVTKSGRFRPCVVADDALFGADVSIIAVGTPSNKDGIDLSYIESAARLIGQYLRTANHYHVVAVKSTVVPGTTGGLVRRALEEASGKKAGVDFGLGMIPEFLREGAAVSDFMNPDRVVIGGLDTESCDRLSELLKEEGCPILRCSLGNAEMIKYASNALLATMISFSNEIAGLCECVPDLDEETVMAGLHLDRRLTVRDGKNVVRPQLLTYLRGGIGFGGSCFPKDVKALREFAAEVGGPHLMLDAVLETNQMRSEAVVRLLERALPNLAGRRVVVAGLAFKEDTDDTRESPGIRLTNALLDAKAKVVVHDPLVKGQDVVFGGTVEVAQDLGQALKGADACLIATRWQYYRDLDWQKITQNMTQRIIFDGRQVVPKEQRGAPLCYLSIGRMF